MKKLFLIFVSFSLLFVIGCQENFLTGPLTSEVAEKGNFQEETYLHGFIKLEGMLADPSRPFNCCLEIRGVIEYEHRQILPDHKQQSTPYYVSLKLAIDAEVFDPCLPSVPTWPVIETSTDKINVQPGQAHSLIKYFRVQGRDDVMYLVCNFIVTTADVRLDGMWLKCNQYHFTNNVSQ